MDDNIYIYEISMYVFMSAYNKRILIVNDKRENQEIKICITKEIEEKPIDICLLSSSLPFALVPSAIYFKDIKISYKH